VREVRLLLDRQTCSAARILDAVQSLPLGRPSVSMHIRTDAGSTNSDLIHRDPPPAESPENITRLKSALSVLDADCSYERWRDIV
jgi:hypothetical protein